MLKNNFQVWREKINLRHLTNAPFEYLFSGRTKNRCLPFDDRLPLLQGGPTGYFTK
jgi:hypothetical protein